MCGPFKIRSQDNTQKLYGLNRLQVLLADRQMLKSHWHINHNAFVYILPSEVKNSNKWQL
jgi:hypothetical protein